MPYLFDWHLKTGRHSLSLSIYYFEKQLLLKMNGVLGVRFSLLQVVGVQKNRLLEQK